MADGWQYFNLERGAWKEGTVRHGPKVVPGVPNQKWAKNQEFEWPQRRYFTGKDVLGETIDDLKGEKLHPWGREWPQKLMVHGFDVDGVIDDVNIILDREFNHIEKKSDGWGKAFEHEAEAASINHISSLKPSTEEVATAQQQPKLYMFPHPEPGDHCCGFITYESLANKKRGSYNALAAFCHVPGRKDEQSLRNGAGVICALIGVLMDRLEKGEIVD